MPIIRIPQAPGASPQALTPTAFDGARAAYDSSEKRRRNQAVAGAINASLQATANIKGQIDREREQEEQKKTRKELQAFDARISAEQIILSRELDKRLKGTEFDPDAREKAINEIIEQVDSVAQEQLSSATTDDSREAMSFWIESLSPPVYESLRSAALEKAGQIEISAWEQTLTDRVDGEGDWADRLSDLSLNFFSITAPPSGALFELEGTETDDYINTYVERPAIDTVRDALSDRRNVRDLAPAILEGNYDFLFGDQKWEARKIAESSVARLFQDLNRSFVNFAEMSPSANQVEQFDVVIGELEGNEKLFKLAMDDTSYNAYLNALTVMKRERVKVSRIQGWRDALKNTGSPMPETWAPFSADGAMAADLAFKDLVGSEGWAAAPIPVKSLSVVNVLSRATVPPDSFKEWWYEVQQRFQRGDPEAILLTSKFASDAMDSGLRLPDFGLLPSLVGEGTSGRSGGKLAGDANALAADRASAGDLVGANEALSSIPDANAQAKADVAKKSFARRRDVRDKIDHTYDAGAADAVPDEDQIAKLYVAASLRKWMSDSVRAERKSAGETRRALERQLEGYFADNVELSDGTRFKGKPNNADRIALALSGKFGDEALDIATRLKERRFASAETKGWDPIDPSEYNLGPLEILSHDIVSYVDARYASQVANGVDYASALQTRALEVVSGYQVSGFARGRMVEFPPEALRPDAMKAFENEFLPGGKLEAFAGDKDRIVENLENAIWLDDQQGWMLDYVMEDGRISKVGGQNPYILRLDNENYTRLLSLETANAKEKPDVDPTTAAIIQSIAVQSALKVRDDQRRERAAMFPTPEELTAVYSQSDGFKFPAIGSRNLLYVMEQFGSPTTYGSAPSVSDMGMPAPSKSLLEKLSSAEERWGYPVLGKEEAMEVTEYLSRAMEWAGKTEARRISEIPMGATPEDQEMQRWRIRQSADAWRDQIREASEVMKPISDWWDSANEFNFNDNLTGETLYVEWRKLNLYGQMKAWRSWKGMPPIEQSEARSALDNWVSTGGYEEWINTPEKIRRAFE